jgi:hypothetical protein
VSYFQPWYSSFRVTRPPLPSSSSSLSQRLESPPRPPPPPRTSLSHLHFGPMASMLADPTTLVVGAASVIGALFFLQNQMGGSSPGEDASDENLDDLAASISGTPSFYSLHPSSISSTLPFFHLLFSSCPERTRHQRTNPPPHPPSSITMFQEARNRKRLLPRKPKKPRRNLPPPQNLPLFLLSIPTITPPTRRTKLLSSLLRKL